MMDVDIYRGRQTERSPTISGHAQCQALLQPAVLASVAVGAVNQAVALPWTRVCSIVLLTPPEEPLQNVPEHSRRWQERKRRWRQWTGRKTR